MLNYAEKLKVLLSGLEASSKSKKLHEIAIAQIMGYKSRENARRMINYVNFLIINKKSRKISNELKELLIKRKLI